MKKDSTLRKIIDLWSLGKVLLSGLVLGYYVVYLYFKNIKYYDAFLTLVQDYLEGEVVLVMSKEEFMKLSEGLMSPPSEDSLDDDEPRTLQ